jgi:predicted DNA-binding transcriptional regulator YafY
MEWYEASLHVANEALEWVMSYNESEVLAEDDGGKTLRMRFPSFRAAVQQITGWARSVRVIDPPDLRSALADHARELLAFYEASV